MNLLSIIIIVLMIAAMFRGYHLGFIRSLTSLIGRLIVYIIAILMAHRLGEWLMTTVLTNFATNWAANGVPSMLLDHSNEFLASGIAFGLIMFIGTMLVRSVERQLRFINKIPLLGTLNRWAGLLVYGGLIYIEIFFVLQFTQMLDIPWYHDAMVESPVAQWILNQTPYFSDAIYQWWIRR